VASPSPFLSQSPNLRFWVLAFSCHLKWALAKSWWFFLGFAGKRKLRLQVRNCVHSIEDQLIMALEGKAKGFSEVNRNLYSQIEPYSSGFLKVSDIHNIYWEQSGNPNGHVSYSPKAVRFMLHCPYQRKRFCLSFCI